MSTINDRLTAVEADTTELIRILEELQADLRKLNTAFAEKAEDDYER